MSTITENPYFQILGYEALEKKLGDVLPGIDFTDVSRYATCIYQALRDQNIPSGKVLLYLISSMADQIAYPSEAVQKVRRELNDFAATHDLSRFAKGVFSESAHTDVDIAVVQQTPNVLPPELYRTIMESTMLQMGNHAPGLPQPFPVPTNPRIQVYDIALDDVLTIQMFPWILNDDNGKLGGEGSTYDKDNRIGLKAPGIGIPLLHFRGTNSVFVSQEDVGFHRKMMSLPFSFPGFNGVDYFDKLEQVFRQMRRRALHAPEGEIFNMSPNHVSNLSLLFTGFSIHRNLAEDPHILDSKIRLICRELLVMRYAWGQERFNSHTLCNESYGWAFSTLIHGLAMYARNDAPKQTVIVDPQRLERLSDEEFACYLTNSLPNQTS